MILEALNEPLRYQLVIEGATHYWLAHVAS